MTTQEHSRSEHNIGVGPTHPSSEHGINSNTPNIGSQAHETNRPGRFTDLIRKLGVPALTTILSAAAILIPKAAGGDERIAGEAKAVTEASATPSQEASPAPETSAPVPELSVSWEEAIGNFNARYNDIPAFEIPLDYSTSMYEGVAYEKGVGPDRRIPSYQELLDATREGNGGKVYLGREALQGMIDTALYSTTIANSRFLNGFTDDPEAELKKTLSNYTQYEGIPAFDAIQILNTQASKAANDVAEIPKDGENNRLRTGVFVYRFVPDSKGELENLGAQPGTIHLEVPGRIEATYVFRLPENDETDGQKDGIVVHEIGEKQPDGTRSRLVIGKGNLGIIAAEDSSTLNGTAPNGTYRLELDDFIGEA